MVDLRSPYISNLISVLSVLFVIIEQRDHIGEGM